MPLKIKTEPLGSFVSAPVAQPGGAAGLVAEPRKQQVASSNLAWGSYSMNIRLAYRLWFRRTFLLLISRDSATATITGTAISNSGTPTGGGRIG